MDFFLVLLDIYSPLGHFSRPPGLSSFGCSLLSHWTFSSSFWTFLVLLDVLSVHLDVLHPLGCFIVERIKQPMF